jgi:ribonuclease Z
MIVVPLGIASATPTITRHLPSVALWREGSIFLFDAGENAQMRLLQAGLKRSKIDTIFISHLDIDHISGLVGLLATFQLQRREKPLRFVGPKGLKEYVEWHIQFSKLEVGYSLDFTELDEGFEHAVVVDEEEYTVEARPLKHSIFCIGYRFEEKDKPGKVNAEKAAELGITEDGQFKALKAGETIALEDGRQVMPSDIVGHPRPGDSFAYVTDTEYCPEAVKLATNANILYHEATFGENLEDKAAMNGHSTASDAARVFSARYTNSFVLLKEAREKFFPTWLATELRPIFTDPAHEKGIVQAKVILKELKDKDPKKSNTKSPTKGKGGFRPRKKHMGGDRGQRREGGASRSRGGYSGSQRDHARPDRGASTDRSQSSGSREHKPITPRPRYDDYDRF